MSARDTVGLGPDYPIFAILAFFVQAHDYNRHSHRLARYSSSSCCAFAILMWPVSFRGKSPAPGARTLLNRDRPGSCGALDFPGLGMFYCARFSRSQNVRPSRNAG